MMKKLWNYNGVRLVLVFILTTVLVYESAHLYLMNGGMFWFAILSFGLYLLFFLLPYGGLFVIQKKRRSKFWLIFILVLVLLHTAIIALYTDPYIYLDEGGISKAKFSQLFRWLAIISGILLVIIYGWKFRETRSKVN
ncbi:hypothetical protein ACRW9N_10955 [Listeria aquatica]|uniref:hypothetical protein n=1 Tax=Listeria aquatica TaxID=1494960 RepID=UPI003EF3895F